MVSCVHRHLRVKVKHSFAMNTAAKPRPVIGIPCSDNVAYPDLQNFLSIVSRAPETVVHFEFMQDFSVHLRHEDGYVEKINFIDIPMAELGDIFPSACLACFDYANTLADITIGYMGAPFGWQWLLARNARGEAMLDLLRPIYGKTAAYGHFGREEPEFSWERTDKAAALRAAA